MSRETEKMLKEMHKFLDENGTDNMTEEEVNKILDEFAKEYNSNIGEVTVENARTADDYLELAADAFDMDEAEKYIKKALELEPDNLDALTMSLDLVDYNAWEYYQKITEAVEKGNKLMEEKGFFNKENVGDFWGILETRPYMRLLANYMEFLIGAGMMVRAAEQGEEMLRLCEGDNLGVRFRLMHIYAFLEQKDKALNLYKKFDEYKETQMLLPLSVLYFKMGNIEKAKEYLELLNDTNKDTKEFFTAINNNELDEHMAEVGDYGYRPFTIEEFIIELMDNNFLFTSAPLFLEWAYEQTRNM